MACENAEPKPAKLAMLIAANSSARKKIRTMKPRNKPARLSVTMIDQEVVRGACREGPNVVVNERRDSKRNRDRNEETKLDRNTIARKSRKHHEAGADAAEDDKRYQDAFVRELDHETEPSD